MKCSAFLLPLLGLAFAPTAWGQPAPKTSSDTSIERVIVTAPRYHFGITPDAIAHDFVKSYAMPSILSEQIPRWETAICPAFYGVAPQFMAVMEARFRTIAGEVGASLKDKGCKPNLVIVVTPQPQAYLDAIHAQNIDVVGYKGTITATHAIQAWYVTGIRDVLGQVFLDHEAFFLLDIFSANPTTIDPTSTAPTPYVGGWRYRPDITSDLLYVTIIVDSNKTRKLMVGEVADYIAMMALSRSEDYDDCQLMPSITNLLSPNCDDKLKPDAITASDIAYLRGVYKMDPGAKLLIQQDEIAAEMAKTLAVGK